MIYLLSKYRLKDNNYSEQKIIRSYFVQANEHEVNMCAKFGYLIVYAFFPIKYFKICFMGILYRAII
jgi:hypothetical protein